MGVRITIEVDGQQFELTPAGVDAAEQAAHVASGLPAASPAALQAADGYDRAKLVAALEAAHERDHKLVELVRQHEASLAQQNDLLRERTIERDHFKEDSLLWSLVVAKFVDDENGELRLVREEINAYMGKMLEANVENGILSITLTERPSRSDEADRG